MSQGTEHNWRLDYDAMISHCGVVPLDGWTQLQVAGSDRVTFLHNMCTNDIRRLEVGHLCEAFCTDVKGRVLAHVLIVARADHLILLTVPGQAERLIAHLERYVIREDVQLVDLSGSGRWQYLVGPRAAEVVSPATFSVKCDLLWPGGCLHREEAGSKARDSIPAIGVESPAFTALRAESFWPLYGSDFDESNLPQEINRNERAISFTKGCYLGQETVARIDALGHVNKKLVLAKIVGEQVPEPGGVLSCEGAEVGVITTAAWSPKFAAPVALAMVRRGFNDVGKRLHYEGRDAEIVDVQ